MMNNVEQLEEVLKDNLLKRTKSGVNPERMLARYFKKMDTDGDQSVSFKEFKTAVEPFTMGSPDELLRALFNGWDTDRSGELSVDKFVNGLFKTPAEREKAAETQVARCQAEKASSIKADDIIDQAKQRRAERLAKDKQYKTTMFKRDDIESKDGILAAGARSTMCGVHARLAGYSKNSPKEELEKRVQTGAFRSAKFSDTPDAVRYRVSNIWMSCAPPATFSQRQVKESLELPKETLSLEWAYGHNADTGLYARDNGEVVYATAGLGVVYNPRKHTQRFFIGHDDDVTSVALDASQRYAATGQMRGTGGKEPRVCIWDVESMREMACTPPGLFERQVVSVAFSHASPKILAAVGADNHHMMAIFDWTTKRVLAQAPTQNGTPPQITCIVFDNEDKSDRFVTCGSKHLKFWTFDPSTKKLGGGKNATYGKISPSPRTIECAVWLPGSTLLVGGSNGTCYLWDAATTSCRRAVPAHNGPVRALLGAADGQVISGGGKDHALHYWSVDPEGRTLKKLEHVEVPENTGSVVGLAFMKRGNATPILIGAASSGAIVAFSPLAKPEWKTLVGGHKGNLNGLGVHPTAPSAFVTAGEDGVLNVWDAESKQVVARVALHNHNNNLTPNAGESNKARSCDIFKDYIAIGFKDGSFCILQAPQYRLVFKAKHCIENIDDIHFSPDGGMLAVASHDNFIDVYSIQHGFDHLVRFKGHTSYITHFDWSSDSRYIQSNCGAYERLVWDVEVGKLLTKTSAREAPPEVHWDTFSCVLGFDVMGIWQPGMDGTDINSVARTNDLLLLATGDDSGIIRLHNYPVLAQGAPAHKLVGHSSHVMNVRWLADSKRLISVGGHDQTVLQWKRRPIENYTSSSISTSAAGTSFTGTRRNNNHSNFVQAQQPWKASTSWK